MMNFSRLRNGKVRALLGLGVGIALLCVTFVVHDTHNKLVATRSQAQDCEHKQESLSAQLQVVHEHRTRLEKALQQEKLAHKQTKEKLESQYEELQEQTDKEKQEAQSKHATLQQQYKALQSQQDDLHEEFSKLQQTNAELQEEKQNLVNKMTSQADQLRISKDEEIGLLQDSVTKLQQEKKEIEIKMDQSVKIGQLEEDLGHCKQQLAALQSSDHSKVQPSAMAPRTKETVKPLGFALGGVGAPQASSIVQLKEHEAPSISIGGKQPAPESLGAGAVDSAPIGVEIQQPINHHPRHVHREGLNLPGVLPVPNIYPPKHPLADAPAAVAQEDKNDGHQLANPHDVDAQPNDEVQRQVEQPHKIDMKKQAMGEPRIVRDHKDIIEAHHRGAMLGQDGEPEANGLEQQENGDQDLDDMENDLVVGGDKKENNQFEDADFDQADQDDNDGNRNKYPQQVKPEGVVAAPH